MISTLRILLAALTTLFALPSLAAFTDNGDGTVTDTVTGLIWDKCSWGQTGNDCAGGAASTHDWAAALGVAITANAASHKGQTDWRLPNRTELESLVNIAARSPAIDITAFPNTPSDWFWTSTTYAPNAAGAWLVYFDSGLTYANGKAHTDHVRLVRSGQYFAPFDAGVTHALTVTKSGAGSGTVTSSPVGIDCGSTCTANFTGGASVTLTAAAATGSSFAGWSGAGCSGTGSCVVSMDAAKNVTASFAQTTYAVTASAGTGGTASCTPNPATHGGSSTCTASPNAGYTFSAWTGDCAGQGAACTLSNITAAKSSAASFTAASATQPNIPTRTSGVTATLAASGCSAISSATFIDAPAGAPGNFPFGLLDFTLTGCASEGSTTVTVTYSQNLPAGAVFYKHINGAYSTYPATLGANTATFSLTDGGAGDADGAANGTIRDPGGVGVPGGSPAVQSIPTLSEWGMIILSLLLAGMTALRLRRE